MKKLTTLILIILLTTSTMLLGSVAPACEADDINCYGYVVVCEVDDADCNAYWIVAWAARMEKVTATYLSFFEPGGDEKEYVFNLDWNAPILSLRFEGVWFYEDLSDYFILNLVHTISFHNAEGYRRGGKLGFHFLGAPE